MQRYLLFGFLVLCVSSFTVRAPLARTLAFIPSGDDLVTRVDATDETFDRVALTGAPFGAAVTPNGVFLLVTRRDADSVTLITTASFSSTDTQVHIPVGDDPHGVAVDSRGRFAYVANFGSNTLSRIDMVTLSVSDEPIETGAGPFGVAAIFDEVDDTVKVYVANNTDSTVSVIADDGVTATPEADISVGTNPAGVALTPDGSFLYVANNGSDNVTVIRTSDNTVLTTLRVGADPWGVAVGSDGDFVYVTNSNVDIAGDGTVSVIATDTQRVQTFDVGSQPRGVAAPKNGDFAYVVDQLDNTISRIDIDPPEVTAIGRDEISNASALGAFIGGTPPGAPSGLVATERSFDEIELTWTDNADDELGFKIERREDSEDTFTQIAKVAADVTTFSDDPLPDITTFHYRVRAFNEAADSGFTPEASATTEEGSFSWCFIQTLLRSR